MSDGQNETRPSPASRVWLSVAGFLAFVAALGKAFEALPKMLLGENQRWIIEFLPDLVIALITIGLAPLLIGRIEWRQSITGVRTQSKTKFAIICAMAVIALALMVPLSARVQGFYRVRYQRAFVDWHAVRALDHFWSRHYDVAAGELKKVASTSITELRPILKADIDARFKDAETLVMRFRAAQTGGRSPNFGEILMVGRAVRLAPQAPGVKGALADSRKLVEEGVAAYVTGVAKIRKGDVAAAAESLRRSRMICRGLLHQDLLLRYTENQDVAEYNADDRGLINYYLHTPDEKLKTDLLAYPPIRVFAPIKLR